MIMPMYKETNAIGTGRIPSAASTPTITVVTSSIKIAQTIIAIDSRISLLTVPPVKLDKNANMFIVSVYQI